MTVLRSTRAARIALLLAASLAGIRCGGEVTGTGSLPTRLAFTTQPNTSVAGEVMPAVVAVVQDDQGNTVTASTATVSITITTGAGAAGASLGGTRTRVAVNGIVTFDDLTIDKVDIAYTLTVTAASLESATSTPFVVTPGAATALALTTMPTSATAGMPMTFVARVRDALGNTVSGSAAAVTMAMVPGSGVAGAALGGTVTRGAVNGVATFSDLTIEKAGTGYRMTATAANVTSDTSVVFEVAPAAASTLTLAGVETSVTAGVPISLQATVRDAFGNPIPGSTDAVTVAIAPGSGVAGAVLGGTLRRAAVAGVATFDDLTIDKAGTGYRLTVTAANLASASSDPITVTPGAARGLTLTGYPTNVTAGFVWAPAIRVAVVDSLGNTVTGSTASITLAITSGSGSPGAVLSGTLTRTAVSGVATFGDLSIDLPGTGYTLTATSPGLADAATGAIAVADWSGSPTLITLTSDPGDYIGAGLSYQYSLADAVITASVTGGRFSLSISGDQWWFATFQSPDSLTQLTPGTYTGLTRYPFHDAAVGGLSWSGEGRGCNTLTGWFAVDAAAYDAGALVGIDLRFEQHCEGQTPALYGTIHWAADDPTVPPGPVNPIPAGLWTPAAGTTPPTGNFVYLESDAGDYIGQGQTYTYAPPTTTISPSASGRTLSVTVDGWYGTFEAMNSLTDLQVGYYGDLRRYPFHNPTKGGLTWSGQGRGCNTLSGWFAIDSVVYQQGTLIAVDLRFEQRCEGGTPALHGAIHWTQ